MAHGKVGRVVVPGRMLGLALIPFAVPAGLAAVLVLAADWPRDIAPGSGLKLPGFLATVLTTLLAWRLSLRGICDGWARRLSALLCSLVGLLAWPLWSAGVLPLVNGAALQESRTVRMTLERVEAVRRPRSREFYHWAELVPLEDGAGLAAGRYFIPEAAHERLAAGPPGTVEVEAATGLLGAVVVLAVR